MYVEEMDTVQSSQSHLTVWPLRVLWKIFQILWSALISHQSTCIQLISLIYKWELSGDCMLNPFLYRRLYFMYFMYFFPSSFSIYLNVPLSLLYLPFQAVHYPVVYPTSTGSLFHFSYYSVILRAQAYFANILKSQGKMYTWAVWSDQENRHH